MKKILFVSPRYGTEVNGGAEMECRAYAERLTGQYDVHVLTTCAKDHSTWENYYPEGEEILNGVHVIRFPVARERNQADFDKVIAKTINRRLSRDEEQYFVDQQGPYCPAMLDYLRENTDRYSAFLYVTYLYYPVVCGIGITRGKSILIPTLHDEWVAYLGIYKDVFRDAAGYIYNSESEKALAEGLFAETSGKPFCIAGFGIDQPDAGKISDVREKYSLSNYILYAGRIEEAKGCGHLFRYFEQYRKDHKNDLKLVLCGKAGMKIPKSKDIISLGFVSDEDKYGLMKNAEVLVMPSQFESLSIVVLESMNLKTPVLVNGECDVLRTHCLKSNAGLYFSNYTEFEKTLTWLRNHPAERMIMGRNGQRYVEENYRWEKIVQEIAGLIDPVSLGSETN